jgi:outer membrane protein assembly factor BamA
LLPDLPRRLVLLGLLVPALAVPLAVQAEQLVVTPSVTLKEEYNDNIFSTTLNRRGDFISTVAPGLAVSRSSERLSASLGGGVSQLWYRHNSSSDGLGYFLRGTGALQLSPRLSLTTDLSGTRDISASSIDPVTSLAVSSRILHQNYRVGGRFQVSELSSGSLSLGYGREDYDSSAYLSTRHYQGSANYEYDLGRLVSGVRLGPQLSFNRDETAISRVDGMSASIGVSAPLNESWQLSASGGGRYTRSRSLNSGSGWHAGDEWGALGNLAVAYQSDRRSANLALSQDLVSASGRSSATQRTGVNLGLSERFTPWLTGNIGAGYARNRARQDQLGAGEIDETYRNLAVSLRYQFLEAPRDLALEASYSYNTTDYRLLGRQMDQNIFLVRLTWQSPRVR